MPLSTVLRGYLMIGSLLIIGLVFIYTNHLIQSLQDQAGVLSSLLARFTATATLSAAEDPAIARAYAQATEQVDFPIIITDIAGRPMAWTYRGTNVHPDSVTIDQLVQVDPRHPPVGPIARVVALIPELDKVHKPIPIEQPKTGQIIGHLHYGESAVVQNLRWYPLAEMLGIILFGSVGYWGFTNIKRAEQQSIYAGLARETAHQLGTPLSSLLGWTELLRDRLGDHAAEPQLQEVLGEIDRDLERVGKVANRFGQIGSMPRMQTEDIVPLVRGAVEYMRRRLPRLGRTVVLEESYAASPPVHLNRELFEWAVENLLRNAADALDGEHHTIAVTVEHRPDSETVEVAIRDTGRGLTPAEQRRVFAPGYTTKAAGWGLGLTLVRRIVEEYHGGRVWIRESAPGRGTTFVMSFPV